MSLNYLLRLQKYLKNQRGKEKNIFLLFYSPQKGTLKSLMLRQHDIFHIGLLDWSERGR